MVGTHTVVKNLPHTVARSLLVMAGSLGAAMAIESRNMDPEVMAPAAMVVASMRGGTEVLSCMTLNQELWAPCWPDSPHLSLDTDA